MKIRKLCSNAQIASGKLSVADSDEAVAAVKAALLGSAVEVNFQSSGDGAYEAVLPCVYPDGGSGSCAPIRIGVQAKSETSANATRRVMFKVTLPYMTFDPSSLGTGALAFAPSRSRNAISAHVVLTLPKECVEDLRGQKLGTLGVNLADKQIVAAIALLNMLIGNDAKGQHETVRLLSEPGAFTLGDGDAIAKCTSLHEVTEDGSRSVTEIDVNVLDGEGHTSTETVQVSMYENTALSAVGGLGVPLAKVAAYGNAVGVDLTKVGPSVVRDPNNPIMRSIMGVKPWSDSDVVGLDETKLAVSLGE